MHGTQIYDRHKKGARSELEQGRAQTVCANNSSRNLLLMRRLLLLLFRYDKCEAQAVDFKEGKAAPSAIAQVALTASLRKML